MDTYDENIPLAVSIKGRESNASCDGNSTYKPLKNTLTLKSYPQGLEAICEGFLEILDNYEDENDLKSQLENDPTLKENLTRINIEMYIDNKEENLNSVKVTLNPLHFAILTNRIEMTKYILKEPSYNEEIKDFLMKPVPEEEFKYNALHLATVYDVEALKLIQRYLVRPKISYLKEIIDSQTK